MGPGVTPGELWGPAFSKMRARSKAIGRGGTLASVPALLYNTCALPVLSYLAQLAEPPFEMLADECSALASVFRFPGGALRRDDWPVLWLWGGPRINGRRSVLCATVVRSAVSTCSGHASLMRKLRRAAEQRRLHRPLPELAPGPLYPDFWASRSYSETLEQVATSTLEHRAFPKPALQLTVGAARASLAPGVSRPRPQRAAAATLAPPDRSHELFQQRLGKLFPHRVDDIVAVDLQEHRAVLRSAPTCVAMAFERFDGRCVDDV